MSPFLSLSIITISLLAPQISAQQDAAITSSSSQAITAVSSTALTDISQTSSVTASTAPARVPNGDPCGPKVQDNPNYPNTCNLTPALAETPSAYSINCSHTFDTDQYPKNGLKWENCAASLNSICTKLEDSRTLPGIWIESKYATNCGLSFFLPPYDGSAPRPSGQRCLSIFTAMIDACKGTNPASTFATVNVFAIPGFNASYWHEGDFSYYPNHDLNAQGEAVNAGYASYLVGNPSLKAY